MSLDDPTLSPAEADREERLLAIVRTYTAAVEAGQKPDRRQLMKQNPDLAADLSACLGGLTFLNQAADRLAATAEDLVDPTAGGPQELGDYRLLKEIGRGGMGVVYEAEQISLGRRVAVKVLPTAAALDSRQLQRFKSEAQAAAHLNHPHIVPVYAVGNVRSTHFYAMQLIEGQSLADVIRDLRDLAEADAPLTLPEASSATHLSTPSMGLSTLRGGRRLSFYQSVARLGLQAAEALHYAHHSGVVHRDIKPANLMLDHDAQLWITDFGLAQFYAEENNLTQTTDRPGTLRYMSPEQASGEALVLDQRTDIYSLGVTLYELLTLERAVPGETREQLMRQLLVEDPEPPRHFDPNIPKELETILMTACAKDPGDRYPTAGLLAEDLRRFLTDQPILAKAPPVTQRLGRWVRRHRTIATSAAVALLVLLTGSLVSTALIAREQAKTREAYFNERDRAADADAERQRATRSYTEARDAVDYFARVASTELTGTRPATDVRREMLEAAVDYYEAFAAEHRGDQAASRELAEAQTQVRGLLSELESVEDAYRLQMSIRMVNDEQVADALKMIPTQRQQAAYLQQQLATGQFGNEPMGDPAYGAPTERQRDRLIRLGQQIRQSLNRLLIPGQMDRLKQIDRQARGPAAFADADVTTALNLTLEQKDAIRAILASARIAARRPAGPPDPDGPRGPNGGPHGPGGPDGPRGPMAAQEPDAFDRFDAGPAEANAARANTLRQLLALLDAGQKAAWQKLIGPPFPDAGRFDLDAQRRPTPDEPSFGPHRHGFGAGGNFGGNGPDGFDPRGGPPDNGPPGPPPGGF